MGSAALAGLPCRAISGATIAMNRYRHCLFSALVLGAGAALTACAPTSSPDYRSRPGPGAQGEAVSSGEQRLSIQAGEGETLNLPWFIRDTQHWINRQ